MRRIQLTDPANQALELTEAKVYANINTTSQDAQITPFVNNAIKYIEHFTMRAMITRTFSITYDCNIFALNRIPLNSLNVSAIDSVTVFDSLNNSTLIPSTDYRLSGVDEKVIIFENSFTQGLVRQYDSMVINVTAGYGLNKTDIPQDLITAMNMKFAHLAWYNGIVTSGDLSNIPNQLKAMLIPYTGVSNQFG